MDDEEEGGDDGADDGDDDGDDEGDDEGDGGDGDDADAVKM